MGEYKMFQPLTKEDRVTVIIYRVGIALSSIIVTVLALAIWHAGRIDDSARIATLVNVLVPLLYVAVGLSVIFIHLYVGRFHKLLKVLYAVAVAALIALMVIGKGSLVAAITERSYLLAFFLPLSGCLGFVTAKEAFCFQLIEGYILAIFMPFYLLLLSAGGMTLQQASYGFFLIAVLLLLFTFRKVFMPLHTDIGDKSAYI